MPTPTDLSGARVLLVGVGGHTPESGLPSLASIRTTVEDLRRVLIDRCGVPPGALSMAVDPESPMRLGDQVADLVEDASDVLIVYYVGHGLLSPGGALHLATAGTDYRPTRVEHTAFPYSTLRQYVLHSRARAKIVILDCCWAGRAVEALGDPAQISEQTAIAGTYVLTAVGPNQLALAPSGQAHTAFTGALLELLVDGASDDGPRLTLDSVFARLAQRLRERGLPVPTRRVTGDLGGLVVADNPAYSPAVEEQPPGRDQPVGHDQAGAGGPAAEPATRGALRRRPAWTAAGVAMALVAGAGGWYGVADRDDAACANPIRLRVGVARELSTVVGAAAENWARSAVVDGRCVRAEVLAVDPADAAAGLAARHGTALGGVTATGAGVDLTAWIPDSSLWLRRLRAVDATTVPVEAPSVASSPVVLAVSKPVAEALGWSARPPTWAAVAQPLTTTTEYAAGLVEPPRDVPALLALTALDDAVPSDGSTVGLLRAFAASRFVLRDEMMRHLPRTGGDVSLGTSITMAPLPEQSVRAHNASAAGASLSGVRPTPSLPSLDYPYVVLPGVAADAAAAARALQAVLTGSAWSDRLRAGQFDPPVTSVAWSAEDVAEVNRMAATWLSVVLPARVLVVFDTAASMSRPVPTAGGATRLEIAKEGMTGVLSLLDDKCAVGVWTFGENIDGSREYRQLMPVAPLSAARAEVLEAIGKVQVRQAGSAGLHSAIEAAYRVVRDGSQARQANMVVVVTDGRRGDDSDLPLSKLVKLLKQPQQPVTVRILGLGPDVDRDRLSTIARATGGDLLVAKDPAKLDDVMPYLLSAAQAGT